jgi:Siphovirus Gp157
MINLKLYEISNEYMKVLDELYSEDNSENGEIREIITKQLDFIQDGFKEKSINVAKYIKTLDAKANAIKEAIEAMQVRMKRAQNQADSLREYLKNNIEKTGITESIECPEFTIKLVQNPPSVTITDESLILDVYKRTKEVITIDKVAIKKDIQEGFEVEGAKLEVKKRIVIQ